MVTKVDTAIVSLWGMDVGAVSWLDDQAYAVFEYEPEFLNRGLDIAPLYMSLEQAKQGGGLFSFPELNKETYLGLPGLLADALPDKFGNAIINTWLVRKGRDPDSFSPVERLCYTGKRGMGGLEFRPAVDRKLDASIPVEINALVLLAQSVIRQRSNLDTTFGGSDTENAAALMDILRVGTSAGGARPKAVIAMNKDGHVLSGQGKVPDGYDYWILKFDGVTDSELGDTKGFGRIEYAYYKMALKAGIHMTECRLLEENGRAHFITKRFDRIGKDKLHLQSLCGIAHYDYNAAGSYGYEQAFSVMRKLRLSKKEAEQQYRRMLFNVVARNQDDHTKNIGFLMDRKGRWRLSEAYDVTFSHNPAGRWTHRHQMSINGKRDGFTREDLVNVGHAISLPHPERILDVVKDAVSGWPAAANECGVHKRIVQDIQASHRLAI